MLIEEVPPWILMFQGGPRRGQQRILSVEGHWRWRGSFSHGWPVVHQRVPGHPNRKPAVVHLLAGPRPEGQWWQPECAWGRRCVDPTHGSWGTQQQADPHWRSDIHQCPHGHPLDGVFTRVVYDWPNPPRTRAERFCKTCRRNRSASARAVR